jgi:asparagine synthase (glutamine-hydrolysing)
MCGIAGILDPTPGADHIEPLARMTAALLHRGPDGSGTLHRAPIWLGHRRLSIIDLDGGHQPMTNAAESLWVVYNGEIYNYVELRHELTALGHCFRTKSDTEVILHAYDAWGTDCVRRFNGMWAFAIWDSKSETLFAARDHFGIKPFYFAQHAKRFLFASEIKALLAGGIEAAADRAALAVYLRDGYLDHNSQTLFGGISQLEPGSWLQWCRGDVKVRQYWPDSDTLAATAVDNNSDDNTARLQELFTDAVRLRLRSDVPIGSCLSGGLDSSAIVATAAALGEDDRRTFNYKTFTATFPGFALDERRYVEQLAKDNAFKPRWVEMSGDELDEDLITLCRAQEIPLASGSLYAQWRVMRQAQADGVKVLLDGQGGDEVFAGYPLFFPAYSADAIYGGQFGRSMQACQALRHEHGWTAASVAKYLGFYMLPRGVRGAARTLMGRAPVQLHERLATAYIPKAFPEGAWSDSRLSELQWDIVRSWQLPSLLHFADRSSMAFGIETRLPFLDPRLVEFGLALGPGHKIRDGVGKWIMREAMADCLPGAIVDRRDKIGFAAPDDLWLQGPVGRRLRNLATSDSLRARNWLDADWLDSAFSSGNIPNDLLWRLGTTELWARTFMDS